MRVPADATCLALVEARSRRAPRFRPSGMKLRSSFVLSLSLPQALGAPLFCSSVPPAAFDGADGARGGRALAAGLERLVADAAWRGARGGRRGGGAAAVAKAAAARGVDFVVDDGPREGEVLSTVVDLTGLEPRLVRAGAGDPALLGLDAPLGGGALDAAAWGGAWVDPEDAAVGV